jgi:hypothetical protein
MVDMTTISDAPGAPPFEDPDPPQPPDGLWSRALAQALNPGTTDPDVVLPEEAGGGSDDVGAELSESAPDGDEDAPVDDVYDDSGSLDAPEEDPSPDPSDDDGPW